MTLSIEGSPTAVARSLSPKGLTMPIAKKRLEEMKTEKDIAEDPEHIMMTLWAKENTRKSNVNFGTIPLDRILHVCTAKCKRGEDNAVIHHHFNSRLSAHERKIAAATAQWLATSRGRGLLHEFFRQLKERDERRMEKLRKR